MNATRSFHSFKYAVMALVIVALSPQLANAAPLSASESVRYTDLNLDTSAGLDALYKRLSVAARRVCGSQTELKRAGSIKQLRINQTCFDATLARALAEVNYPARATASR
ncbi:MAG: UrcA family protein [Pseudomonadota bacterium]